MKKFISIILIFLTGTLFISFNANAVTYGCTITASEARSGATGGKESYLMIVDGTTRYYLGLFTDERARLRFSMAMTATATGQTIILEYYNKTCVEAANDATVVPNGMRLLAT